MLFLFSASAAGPNGGGRPYVLGAGRYRLFSVQAMSHCISDALCSPFAGSDTTAVYHTRVPPSASERSVFDLPHRWPNGGLLGRFVPLTGQQLNNEGICLSNDMNFSGFLTTTRLYQAIVFFNSWTAGVSSATSRPQPSLCLRESESWLSFFCAFHRLPIVSKQCLVSFRLLLPLLTEHIQEFH